MAVFGLVATPYAWGVNLVWTGADLVSPNDVSLNTNWSNGPLTGTDDSWFVNIDDTAANYPIYTDANGTTAIWDLMVGRDDDWNVSHPHGPGAFKQTGGTIKVDATFQIGGHGPNGLNKYIFEGGFINKAALGDSKVGCEGGTALMTMSNNAEFNQAGWSFYVGDGGGSVGTLMMSGTSHILNANGNLHVAQYGSQGNVTMSEGSYIQVSGDFHVGRDNGSIGTFTMIDTAKVTSGGEFDIGAWGGTGTMNIGPTATFTASGWSSIGNGGNGDTHVGSLGTMNTSGTVTNNGPVFIGRSGGSGVWNQTGGTTTITERLFLGGDVNGNLPTSTATLNVSGNGVMALRQICPWGNAADRWLPYDPNYSSTANFAGGTLQVQPDTEGSAEYFITAKNSNQFNVYLMAGGLTVDTNYINSAIRVPLQDGSAQPGGTAGGGLTKIGYGDLTLRGTNTYTGPTTVASGALRIPGTTSLATTSVSVASGATFDLGRAANLAAPLTSLNLESGSTLAMDLTDSTGGANAIATSDLPNKSGLNFAIGAQGLSLDTATPYTLITGYNNTATATPPTVTLNIRGYTPVVTVGDTATTVSISGALANANLAWWPATADWDVNANPNWIGADGLFMELDNVTFDDSVGNAQNVNVVGKVHPSNIVIDNSLYSYVFQGTGSIVGIGTTVTKIGVSTASFRMAGGAYYTGMTTLSGGTLDFACGDVTLTGGITLDGGALGVSDNGFGTTTVTVASDLVGTGTNGLTKNGSGTLILLGASNYTGPTALTGGGVVQIGSLAQLGTSSDDAANLVLDDVLHYTGPAAALTRSFTSGSNNGGLWIDNDVTWSGVAVSSGTWSFTKSGAGTWTIDQNATSTANGFGHLKLEQGLTVINGATVNANDVWLGNMTTANLTMTSGASLHSNNNFNMAASDNGNPGNSTLTMTDSSIVIEGWAGLGNNNNLCHGTVIMNDSTFTSNRVNDNGFHIGENAYAEVTLNGNSAIKAPSGRFRIGAGGGNGHATVWMHDTSSIVSGTPGAESIALGRDGGGSSGVINMDGHNTAYDRLSGSSITCGGPFEAGRWGGAYGEVNMTGASYVTTADYTMFGCNGSKGKLTMADVTDYVSHNDFHLGSWGGTGTLTMSGAAHLTVDTGMGIARYGENGNSPKATIEMSGTSEIHSGTWINLGTFDNADGRLTMRDSAWVDLGTKHEDQWSNFGYQTGKATVEMFNDSRMTVANKGLLLGERGGAVGSMTLHNDASLTVTTSRPDRIVGTDSAWDNGAFVIGKEGGTGTIVLLDGSSLVGDNTNIQLGYSYDDWQAPYVFGTGVVNVVGGSATVSTTGAGQIVIGSVGGQGIWNQIAGTTTTANPVILGEYDIKHQMHPEWGGGVASWGMGSLYLQGGVFQAPQITTRSNAAIAGTSGTVYFQGGTLKASADSASFITSDGNGSTMTLLVGSGLGGLGAVIDTQGFGVTINEAMQHDAAGPAIDGGLRKLGTGSLTLTADPTYTGDTTVNAGTLTVGNLNTPSATVYVATGTTLNATSIVADTLTIGGAPLAAAAQAVPEPSVLALLVLAGVAFVGGFLRRK
jgi:autotransporter-associated beta strand protein